MRLERLERAANVLQAQAERGKKIRFPNRELRESAAQLSEV